MMKKIFALTTVIFNVLLFSSCSNNVLDEKKYSAPNIIFILLDDVSAVEFNFYNGPGIHTPAIDLMARDGTVFKTAWSQPLCGPSRATLLTGKYAYKNHHYSNTVRPNTSIHKTHYTLGTAMKDAGYRTGWFGKQPE